MTHVLIVDDDRAIREVLRFALEKDGHRVTEAADGAAALARFAADAPDLVILDVLMPEEDGLTVCRRLRETSAVPILFLSSRDEEIDRVLGLDLGGDDYLGKPFSPRELVARVRALLRRARGAVAEAPPGADPPPLRRGRLVLDPARFRCTWDGREVPLTPTEFAVLRGLFGSPGRVFTRDELVERAWGDGHHITERTVDSHVRHLRRKLAEAGGEPIETVHGVGYRLREG